MLHYQIKDEFIQSLNTLLKYEEKFFNVRLPSDKILKISINSSGCNWVLKYKSNLIEPAKELKKDLNINVSDEVFCFVYYFFQFVMQDFLILKKFLPGKASQILDIGAGIGLFELFLNHLYGSTGNISIVEVNELLTIEHHKKEKKNIILDEPLHVLDAGKEFLHKNNISNVTFIDSKNVYNKLNKPYDLVISIRSWGFLVDFDDYVDFVNHNMTLNGIVITDINKRTVWKRKFEKYFNNTRVVKEYVAHYRMIGTRK